MTISECARAGCGECRAKEDNARGPMDHIALYNQAHHRDPVCPTCKSDKKDVRYVIWRPGRQRFLECDDEDFHEDQG